MPPATEGTFGAHDPTVIPDVDGTFVMVSTDTLMVEPGAGAELRVSDDLVHWHWLGRALTGVPAAAQHWSGAEGLWAPEIVHRLGEFRMYYSASTFGSRTSAIGFATAPSAKGPWQDRGVVLQTHHDTSVMNAIDAAVVQDSRGDDWLLYGSFFGGLRILPLKESGWPVAADELGVPVARRHPADDNGAIEGAHILWNQDSGRYYLFCSFDSLFDGYHVRAARSRALTGQYVDVQGRSMMMDDVPGGRAGNVLVSSHVDVEGRTWLAPGHSSHLRVGDDLFLVNHVRHGDDPTRHSAQIRQMGWTSTGWPVVSPRTWGGYVDEEAPLPTQWVATELPDDGHALAVPRPADVEVTERHGNQVKIRFEGQTLPGVVFQDRVLECAVASVAAVGPDGATVWFQGAKD